MSSALNSLSVYLLVALGGACGASLRFFISQFVLNWLGKGFPFATLIVNISGSFIMGLLYGLIEQGSNRSCHHQNANWHWLSRRIYYLFNIFIRYCAAYSAR